MSDREMHPLGQTITPGVTSEMTTGAAPSAGAGAPEPMFPDDYRRESVGIVLRDFAAGRVTEAEAQGRIAWAFRRAAPPEGQASGEPWLLRHRVMKAVAQYPTKELADAAYHAILFPENWEVVRAGSPGATTPEAGDRD